MANSYERSGALDQVKVYPNRQALVEAVAEDIAACAQEAIEARGQFSIALSGGQTPGPLFDRLASHAYGDQIIWGSVHVFWGDDRTVPPDHEDSNYRMARERLLDRVPISTAQIHRIHTELAPEQAADHYEGMLRQFFAGAPKDEPQPRFDYLLQGMGADGHTASLFPGAPLFADQALAVPVEKQGDPPVPRVSMTLPLINAAARIVFLVRGEEKAKALLDLAAAARDPSLRDPGFPAGMVAPIRGTLLILADAEAGSLLPTAWRG